MRAHPSAQRIDALAHGMLEREQVEPLQAHVAACDRCARLLGRRLSEADRLRGLLATPMAPSETAPLRWVAAAMLLAAAASFLWSPARRPGPREAPSSPAAAGAFLSLQDGTQVLGGSAVRRVGWREVEAGAGEYYFDVARAEGVPFLVRTPAGEVRVVGTKFFLRVEDRSMNVKAATLVAVVVVSGAVVLWNSLGSLHVGPTQTAVMDPESPPRRLDGADAEGPVLVSGSPQRRIAQLEAELRESRLRIEQLEAKGVARDAAPARADASSPADVEAAQARFVEVAKRYASGTAMDDDLAELMKMAKDRVVFGRILESLRKRIQASPDDLEARLLLVQAESAGVHVAESIADRAAVGQRVREQIAEVLKRDPDNWEARYTRAVGISHSQKDPKGRADAIREFEAVRVLQESRATEPRFARTYAQLATVYLSERNTSAARATLEAGLARHPDADALRRLLDTLPAAGS